MDHGKTAKTESYFKQILNAGFLAGIIILLIGVYYWAIKAGVPYQDPPLELQIQYAVNMGIGETLVKTGFLLCIYAGIARLVFRLLLKKRGIDRTISIPPNNFLHYKKESTSLPSP